MQNKILILGGAPYVAELKDYNVIALNLNEPKEGVDRIVSGECFDDTPITHIFFVTNGDKLFIGDRNQFRDLNPHCIRYEWLNILRKSIGSSNPLMGTIALEFVRKEFDSFIHVDGMNFYHEKDKPPPPFKWGSHNLMNDINYFKWVKKVDARVSFSDEIERVLALYP